METAGKVAGMGTGIMLSILAGDLLYLYSIGAWHDSNGFIEVSEVVALCVLFLWGLGYVVVIFISMFQES